MATILSRGDELTMYVEQHQSSNISNRLQWFTQQKNFAGAPFTNMI